MALSPDEEKWVRDALPGMPEDRIGGVISMFNTFLGADDDSNMPQDMSDAVMGLSAAVQAIWSARLDVEKAKVAALQAHLDAVRAALDAP